MADGAWYFTRSQAVSGHLLEQDANPELPGAVAIWDHFNRNEASCRKYNDAPPEFVALSRLVMKDRVR